MLVIGLGGCSASEKDALVNDIQKNELTKLSYKVGGFKTFKCDALGGQKALKIWSNSLKQAVVASWPSPDNYLELSFNNGHKYSLKTFIGLGNLKYSVLYASSVYTGEQLMIESVCPGLRAHNQSLNQIGAKLAPPG
ncbi:MAG: hypothetical protein OQL27_03040 [Sedimenticola sp.]|nr:hypothetical protein [Sedimenticola sp.]